MRNIRCIHLMLALVIVAVALTMGSAVMANASAQYDIDQGQAVLTSMNVSQSIGQTPMAQTAITKNVDIGQNSVAEATSQAGQQKAEQTDVIIGRSSDVAQNQQAWSKDPTATARNGTNLEESSFVQVPNDRNAQMINSIDAMQFGNGGWNDVIKWNDGADTREALNTVAMKRTFPAPQRE